MSNKQARKRYERWRDEGIPKEVGRDDVISVLEEFFPGKKQHGKGSNEPAVVKHPAVLALKRFSGFPPAIPQVSGSMVKRVYVENLVYMIGWIRIWRQYCERYGLDELDGSKAVLEQQRRLSEAYEAGRINDGQIEDD